MSQADEPGAAALKNAADLRAMAEAEEVRAALERGELTFTDEPYDPLVHGELPPPGDETVVVSVLRLPLDVHLRAQTLAETRGVPTEDVLRELIETSLADLDSQSG